MGDERLIALRKKAAALPPLPGVYIMKNADGQILYVGKSRALCHRVGSYFVGTHSGKTARMVAAVHDFDTVLCKTEMEALTLENALIKQHAPYFNIKLKDAKSYPYLKITDEPYPRITVTRDRRHDGEYFGPYPGMAEAYAALDAVVRAFRLPTCRRRFPEDIGRGRPCLYADMGRCMALCRDAVPPEEYALLIRRARHVLSGHIGETLRSVNEAMQRAAEEERFEEAARLRDTAAALSRLREKQRVVLNSEVECDAVALHSEGGSGILSLLSVREGVLHGKQDYPFTEGELDTPEAIFTFLSGLYGEGSIPREVLLGFSAEDDLLDEFAESLSLLSGRRVRVLVPERGKKRELVHMAAENARLSFDRRAREREREDALAARLASLLSLEVVPERVEAYDISELGNEAITGAMVVFCGGRRKSSDYRLFRLESLEKANDYAAMKETLLRRVAHIGKQERSLGERPDLILVDGGAPQVSAAREALAEQGFSDIPVFGMVKDDYHKTRALTDGEREVSIATDRGIYSFIYTVQEEVHRFAVASVHKKKRKSLRRSVLENIAGIGPRKAKILMTHYGSLARVKEASADELSTLPGITAANARQIVAYFSKKDGDTP